MHRRNSLWIVILTAVLVLLFMVPENAHAAGVVQGWAERGGERVNVLGLFSSARYQRSYPGALIEVFLQGTLTPEIVYQDAAFTIPYGTSLTADPTGRFKFYTDETMVDLRFSGGGISGSFTITHYSGIDLSLVYISQAAADTRYLKLAADNDPLTGTLDGTSAVFSGSVSAGTVSASTAAGSAVTGTTTESSSSVAGVKGIATDANAFGVWGTKTTGQAGGGVFGNCVTELCYGGYFLNSALENGVFPDGAYGLFAASASGTSLRVDSPASDNSPTVTVREVAGGTRAANSLAFEVESPAEVTVMSIDREGDLIANSGTFTSSSLGVAVSTTPAAADNDTSVATTAFVQSETLNQTEGDARYLKLAADNDPITGAVEIDVAGAAANAKLLDVQEDNVSVASIDAEGDLVATSGTFQSSAASANVVSSVASGAGSKAVRGLAQTTAAFGVHGEATAANGFGVYGYGNGAGSVGVYGIADGTNAVDGYAMRAVKNGAVGVSNPAFAATSTATTSGQFQSQAAANTAATVRVLEHTGGQAANTLMLEVADQAGATTASIDVEGDLSLIRSGAGNSTHTVRNVNGGITLLLDAADGTNNQITFNENTSGDDWSIGTDFGAGDDFSIGNNTLPVIFSMDRAAPHLAFFRSTMMVRPNSVVAGPNLDVREATGGQAADTLAIRVADQGAATVASIDVEGDLTVKSVASVNGQATAGTFGVAPIVASIALSSQEAAIATTDLLTAPPAGLYEVCPYYEITRAATTSSNVRTVIGWTGAAGIADTGEYASVSSNILGDNNMLAGSTSFHSGGKCVQLYLGSGNLTYSTVYASSGATTMQYFLTIVVRRLN